MRTKPIKTKDFLSFFILLVATGILIAATPKNPVINLSKPVLLNLSLAAPDVIVLKVQAQRVIHGVQIPYEKMKDDQIVAQNQHRSIKRDGAMIGCLVGKDNKILSTLEKIVGDTLDTKAVYLTESYTITDSDKNPIAVKKVFRKSRPVDCVRGPAHEAFPIEHDLVLQLNKPLKVGKTYKVQFKDGLLSENETSFTFDPLQLRSEAVHVSQVGFRPDDPSKLAFLSFWMGDGGNLIYPAENSFSLIDQNSGKTVFSGKTKFSKAVSDNTNNTAADIHLIDFSGFKKAGTYKVSVDGVGCSFPFEISNEAWKNAFVKSMRGLYVQRNGIALGPPVTNFVRPRGFRPEDGVKVYISEPKREGEDPAVRELNPELKALLASYQPGPKNIFQRLINDITNQTLLNAWGGYMDAGDWDRRPDHALIPLMLFDLAEMFPETYSKWSFNTTDSNDKLPDLINEALWEVDFLRRMQQPDGSIYGAIESGEHPRRGECSWQESLPVMAYSRNRGVAYNYVANGARAALWFKTNKQANVANGYLESALKAWDWAEKSTIIESRGGSLTDPRCLAAAELYRLTGEKKYHDIFLEITRFADPASPFYKGSKAPETDQQGEAGWTYLMTKHKDIDQKIRQNILNALQRDAYRDVLACQETDFRWWGGANYPLWWGALSMPGSHALCRAHFITGKEEYLTAIINSTLTGAGANPLNMSYVTGVGSRYPLHPLHEDAYNSNQEVYEGITVGGPIDPKNPRHANGVKIMKKVYPEAKTWPATESYYDAFLYPPMNEFTVHQTMLPTSFVWGYLAARK
jgi:endoglucanase